MADDNAKASRRLSRVIKQDAANSGVANLIGANEVAGGAMKVEIAALREEIEAKGLGGQVKSNGNMSLKAEIKMLRAVLDQQAATLSATPSSLSDLTEHEEEHEEQHEEEEEEHEEDVPALEEVAEVQEAQTTAQAQQSRGEKKARKAMSKLGLVPVPGIVRVTMKRGRDSLLVFASPEVFKAPSSQTYVVFGEAKLEDAKSNPFQQAAQQYKQPPPQTQQPRVAAAAGPSGEVDETGVDPKDIELVLGQAGCSRGQAVTALRNNDNDIVSAIMELTM